MPEQFNIHTPGSTPLPTARLSPYCTPRPGPALRLNSARWRVVQEERASNSDADSAINSARKYPDEDYEPMPSARKWGPMHQALVGGWISTPRDQELASRPQPEVGRLNLQEGSVVHGKVNIPKLGLGSIRFLNDALQSGRRHMPSPRRSRRSGEESGSSSRSSTPSSVDRESELVLSPRAPLSPTTPRLGEPPQRRRVWVTSPKSTMETPRGLAELSSVPEGATAFRRSQSAASTDMDSEDMLVRDSSSIVHTSSEEGLAQYSDSTDNLCEEQAPRGDSGIKVLQRRARSESADVSTQTASPEQEAGKSNVEPEEEPMRKDDSPVEVCNLSPRVLSCLTNGGMATDGLGVIDRLTEEVRRRALRIHEKTGVHCQTTNWFAAERSLITKYPGRRHPGYAAMQLKQQQSEIESLRAALRRSQEESARKDDRIVELEAELNHKNGLSRRH
eukprot:TRINITY_DN21047_c0_g1_i1.p1 TRINITY_DN21047_c0_g1~~TRINITY_DN21047_c0_g1_i1.p1  ORF type:complete len:448 (+),score=69.44 TRINITY_DN21047_c0_g1_i1:116-1459(+)